MQSAQPTPEDLQLRMTRPSIKFNFGVKLKKLEGNGGKGLKEIQRGEIRKKEGSTRLK